MAKYSDIKGFTVQTLSTDTVASQILGGTWASGANLNTGRDQGGGAGVSQTATVVFGGQEPTASAKTESYNGSAWTELNDLNTARTQATKGQGGIYTSAIYGMGPGATTVESWNGSSWTEIAELNTARYNHGMGGASNTSSLIFGGEVPGVGFSALTETWNGSAWTETNDLNTARNDGACAGTPSASLYVGGQIPPNAAGDQVESWNGSSWSELSEISYVIKGSAGFGTYTEAVITGGLTPAPASVATVQYWDGSSWTEIADIATARYGMMGGGTATAGLVAGGSPARASTEEFTAPSVFTKITEGQLFFNSTTNTFKETIQDIPAGTWASAANLNGSHGGCGASGTVSTASLVFGGTGQTVNTESFNGSSWTEVNNLNQGRIFLGGQGTQTSALAFGGEFGGPPPVTAITENWNGSSWTEVNDMNTARYTLGSGTQGVPVTLAVGGWLVPGVSPAVESYDGTSWTEIAEMNVARNGPFVSGDSANAISAGGSSEPPVRANAEVWNGTSWTEVADLNVAKYNGASGGTSTLALASAGAIIPSYVATTEFWNGSSWTEIADLSSIRGYVDGAGAGATNQMVAGGNNPAPALNLAEEFSAPLANKTITAS